MNGDLETTQKEFLKHYEMHSDALFRHCYFRVPSRDIALDLTQDAFLKTWEYISQGKHIDNMKAFLFKVLGNAIIDYYRKHKTESLDLKLDEGVQFASNALHDNSIQHAEISEIVRAITKLPPLYKDVVFMRYVDDLSPQEIADVMGESENVISVRIHRGVEKLKEILHI